MTVQIQLSEIDHARREDHGDGAWSIAPDLGYLRLAIVNVVFFGAPGGGDRNWVLIDTGLPTSRSSILAVAEKRFGTNARPAAIILTHRHFDHVGPVLDLANKWDVPVFAHPLERPYLDGTTSYPPPDPWVGGGLMALLSPLFPRGPIDLGSRLEILPGDGSIPGMPGWQWLHTPGHAPGHISLWREEDGSLIVGDAFITTGQESVYEVAVQDLEMHGPPRYFTPDWEAAERSVKQLAALKPRMVISGHGAAAAGAGMRQALESLAERFREFAVPPKLKFVREPATVPNS
ncbi:MBL fold metallo-hydrolase [Mesorhizobium opportunistum]|uniref:MBL fold metallo-hydrolase n=1 Tax=Mesorhizobium opportunistum TaxID=593909 RepID=A0ABV1YPX9_9HYPH|nr:MBL fold metallo-hydrolase [Mesorhizobium sp.]TIN91089.1 MAG: MBL fold metallo-hydrolase [Mesorhizobium sp.]TJU94542.1 MAG: MBL fold metallo-hydrolase [Mesorhizobium sp.]TJV13886.1 MAG: MBL fold metallo-hydrolase [Mesorhizobium sp.]